MVYTANGGFLIDGIAYGAKFRFQERGRRRPGRSSSGSATNGFDTRRARRGQRGRGRLPARRRHDPRRHRLPLDRRQPPRDRRRVRREVVLADAHRPALLPPRHRARGARPGARARRTAARAREHRLPPVGVRRRAARRSSPSATPTRSTSSDEDGAVFGLNSASDGYNVIISPRAKGFEKQLRERGYNPVLVDLSELLLGGGGIKCCTLELRGA